MKIKCGMAVASLLISLLTASITNAALQIMPTTGSDVRSVTGNGPWAGGGGWEGVDRWDMIDDNGNLDSAAVAAITGFTPASDLLLHAKMNTEGEFEGVLKSVYSISITDPNGGDDYSSATVSYTGDINNFVAPEFLVVKDGSRGDPKQFIFDLSQVGPWDGTMAIELSGFWEGVNGSISNVALHGVIPEPGSIIVWSMLGLVGLAVSRKNQLA